MNKENVNLAEIEKELENQNTIPITFAPKVALPTYEHYPKWLDHSGLPPTARIVYKTIYNRAFSLSLKNHDQYTNDQGHVFVIYTNDDLVKDCGVKLSALKSAKSVLKAKRYIVVEPIEHSSAVLIYPYYPKDAEEYQFNTKKKPNDDTSNSSFDTDDFFTAAVNKSLGANTYPSKD